MPTKSSHQVNSDIRSLTGLRGVAACYVVVFHFLGKKDTTSAVYHLVNHGYLAVDFFFVLSGFVMALNYGGQFLRSSSWAMYFDFLAKRIARIYPLYFVLTLAVMAMSVAGLLNPMDRVTSALSVVSSLAMVQTWGIADSVVGPTWSISVEFGVYLIFPLLMIAILGAGRVRLLLGAICSAALLALLVTRTQGEMHQSPGASSGPLDIFGTGTGYPMLRCLAGFVLGLVAYGVTYRMRAMQRFLADLIALTILLLLIIPQADIVIVLLCPLLVAALVPGQSLAARVLSGAVPYFLGEVSYSLYLIHQPMASVLRGPFTVMLSAIGVPHAFTFAVVAIMALALLVSVATYYWIEKPARRWLRVLIRATPRPIDADVAAP